MSDHRVQCRIGAVVTIGRCLRHVAQAGRAKLIGIGGISGDPEAPNIAGMGFKTCTFARSNLGQGNGVKPVIGLELSRIAFTALNFARK